MLLEAVQRSPVIAQGIDWPGKRWRLNTRTVSIPTSGLMLISRLHSVLLHCAVLRVQCHITNKGLMLEQPRVAIQTSHRAFFGGKGLYLVNIIIKAQLGQTLR